MKFKGEPNLTVRINKPIKGEVKSFHFDEYGFYETNHPTTIKRLQANFETVTEEIKKENSATGDKPTEEKQEEKKTFKCKKCNFETDNQGILMRHYKEHKKEE